MRIKEEKINIFSFESILSFVVVNGLMRFIGFISRVALIIIGLIFAIILVALSLLAIII
jgi:hypothetical protein